MGQHGPAQFVWQCKQSLKWAGQHGRLMHILLLFFPIILCLPAQTLLHSASIFSLFCHIFCLNKLKKFEVWDSLPHSVLDLLGVWDWERKLTCYYWQPYCLYVWVWLLIAHVAPIINPILLTLLAQVRAPILLKESAAECVWAYSMVCTAGTAGPAPFGSACPLL